MSDMTVGILGATAGLLVALFGNLVLLPYVLRHQDRHLSADYRTPVAGWDKQKIASLTRLMYCYFMPVFWVAFGALAAVLTFGGYE
jgi:hypothetical protein